MEFDISVIETKKSRASFRSNIEYVRNQTLAYNESSINKMALILWWSLHIQFLPGISIGITRKMKKNIRIINAKKQRPGKFRHHILFTLIPGTFISLYQVKG